MIEHLEKYALIKESQHGFVKDNSASEMTCIVSSGALNSTHSLTVRDKSCLTNLLIFMEEVTSYIDSGFLLM